MNPAPFELPGLRVELDKLVYRHGGEQLPPDRPHAFIYYLTITNDSPRTVTLLGRKWVVEHADGTQLVVEGDKIVGETPRLAPGGNFSYNSYHVTACNARAHGSFHGLDEDRRRIFVRIPAFELTIPGSA
ncbi:MAG: ApaG domain [Opitutae bacterium]|nr:ApaG domain [Opitutae bacterium]